jgi:HPt (histidine-containing phosphotransfer) domain-containing protein
MNTAPRSRRRKSDSFLRRSGDLFLREAPARVEALWAAGKSKDYQGVAIAAHTLACLASNIEATVLAGLSTAAEKAAESGKREAEKLPDIFFDLDIAYAEARAGLQRMPEIPAPAGGADRPDEGTA